MLSPFLSTLDMQKIYLYFGVLFLGGEFGGRRFIPTRRGHVKYHCFGWFCAMLFIDSVTILCLSMIVNDYAMRFGRRCFTYFLWSLKCTWMSQEVAHGLQLA